MFITSPHSTSNIEDIPLNKKPVQIKSPRFPKKTKTCPTPSLPPKLPKSYSDLYITGKKLGEGSSCTVRKCFRRSDKKEFAVKIINKQSLTREQLSCLKTEYLIMKKLSHKKCKYIINLIDIFETSTYVYFVMELCHGNDLFSYIVQHNKMKPWKINEQYVALIFYQITRAVHECHKLGITHRDLKPENILFKHDNHKIIKIADFGLSYVGSHKMHTKCGSPNFIAPELLINKHYTTKIDWWACGVTLYMLLSGLYPFYNQTDTELYRTIVTGKYTFPERRWNNISQDAKDLVSKLLVTDPKQRYGYREILSHPFLIKNLVVKKKN